MHVRIGSVDFDPGECIVKKITRQSAYTPRGEHLLITETYNFEGELIPPNDLDHQGRLEWIHGRMGLVHIAMRADNLTIAGVIDDFGNETNNMMRPNSTGSINGIGTSLGPIRAVAPVNWGYKDQAEGLTGRTFSFALQLDYDPTFQAGLYDWQESIEYIGDTGAEFVAVELDTGLPDIQQVREKTIQIIKQSGTITGIGAAPSLPGAQFPSLTRAERPRVREIRPRKINGVDRLFGLSYTYSMYSTFNQFGG